MKSSSESLFPPLDPRMCAKPVTAAASGGWFLVMWLPKATSLYAAFPTVGKFTVDIPPPPN